MKKISLYMSVALFALCAVPEVGVGAAGGDKVSAFERLRRATPNPFKKKNPVAIGFTSSDGMQGPLPSTSPVLNRASSEPTLSTGTSLEGVPMVQRSFSEGNITQGQVDYSTLTLDEQASEDFIAFLRSNIEKSSKLGFSNSSKSCGDFKTFIQKFQKGYAGPGSNCRVAGCSAACASGNDVTAGSVREALCLNVCIRGVPMSANANGKMKEKFDPIVNRLQEGGEESYNVLKKHWEDTEGLGELGQEVNQKTFVETFVQANASLKNIQNKSKFSKGSDKETKGRVEQKKALVTALADLNIKYLVFKDLLDKVQAAVSPLKQATDAVVKQHGAALKAGINVDDVEALGRKEAVSLKSKLTNLRLSSMDQLTDFTLEGILRNGNATASEVTYYHGLVVDALKELGASPAALAHGHSDGSLMSTPVLEVFTSTTTTTPAVDVNKLEAKLSGLMSSSANRQLTASQRRGNLIGEYNDVQALKTGLFAVLQQSKNNKLSTEAALVLTQLNS
jgi:hypothetical protein